MSFKDHFSGHAALYAKYRPDYPPALYEFLATLTAAHDCALDCATGSGQAAIGLARHFDCVIATDGSVAQLRHAQPHERVRYVANLAEQPAFRDGSMDLVAAAQAAHWFDHPRFHAGVRRVASGDVAQRRVAAASAGRADLTHLLILFLLPVGPASAGLFGVRLKPDLQDSGRLKPAPQQEHSPAGSTGTASCLR